jgi:hypothetical protein
VGAQDYVGLSVADHVQNFELVYERTTVVNTQSPAPQNESLEIIYFAEIRKQLSVSNGNVLVSYV